MIWVPTTSKLGRSNNSLANGVFGLQFHLVVPNTAGTNVEPLNRLAAEKPFLILLIFV